RDLKDRGYVIKTGFKYGSEFRLYNRGGGPGEGHSDYLVKIIFENYDINVLDFASYVRVSHGVNKKLLLAIVDEDFDITYYNVEWTRP
ncbi:MAG: tRNA-intron lyase, partial [Methanobrevibacter sp.]|nr:tRNA-intron lyase [Methanobrevibacter sp.]